jgi:pimeloyl-ACP methyl ester carboxylesterase
LPTALAHDGTEFEYEVEGQGPTLLLYLRPRAPRGPVGIPTRRLRRAFSERLAERFRLVTFNYPGAAKPDTLTPGNVTKDLLRLADAVGADRFGYWGYSWGAVIGMQLACATDRVSALVCGGFPPLHGPYAEMLRVSEHVHGKVSRLPVVHRPLPARTVAGVQQFVTYYEGLRTFDDAQAQPLLTCPRLCYAGTEDHVRIGGERVASIGGLVERHRDDLTALGWDVETIPGLNHLKAMHPDALMPLLVPWLEKHRAAI